MEKNKLKNWLLKNSRRTGCRMSTAIKNSTKNGKLSNKLKIKSIA